MASAFELMQKHYRQRDLAAREWKKTGGKVVGYFCDSTPEEFILAAGFFPLRITGDPRSSIEETEKFMDPVYEGFVLSSVNMLLTGRYDFLDFLILPRARDSVAQLYANLRQIQVLDPTVRLPELYSFEFNHARSYRSQFYNLDRMYELKQKLEEWSGKKISNQALSCAIAITNENRIGLKKVADLRIAEPSRLSGVEALEIIGSSMFMLKEEHNRLLKQFIANADHLPTRDDARLFVEASPLDNLQFYKLVESCGATIVAEDNCWGNRYSDGLIDTSRNPVEAIADRYQFKSPCPFVYPQNVRVDYCLQKAVEAKIHGAVFYISDWDPAQLWDYPEQKRALEKNGIPTVVFMQQKYLLSEPDSIKARIEEFIQTNG